MNPLRLLTVILMVTSMMLSTSAQEETSKKKGKFEIASGFNASWPKQQMANHMEEKQFGADSRSWFWGEIEYPSYNRLGFTAQISYSHYLDSLSRLGILLQYSYWGIVTGNSYTAGTLSIEFSNVAVVPFYTFDLSNHWEIQVGPALMINKGINYHPPPGIGNTQNYKKISPGLFFGLNLIMWDNNRTYGKTDTNLLLTIPSKMGPYTAIEYDQKATLRESKIGFSHLSFLFTIGIHL